MQVSDIDDELAKLKTQKATLDAWSSEDAYQMDQINYRIGDLERLRRAETRLRPQASARVSRKDK